MCLCSIKYDVVRALNEFGAMNAVQLAKAFPEQWVLKLALVATQ